MPKTGNFWNLDEWLRRLGLSSDSPPLLPGVQPVVVLGDHSEVTSPLQAPTAMIGGRFSAGGGTRSSLVWKCNSPGGCYVLGVSFRNDSGLGLHVFNISTTQRVLGGVITPTVLNMGPDPVQGFPRMGSDSIALGDLLPLVGNPSQFLSGSSWFVPPSSEIQIQSFTISVPSNFYMLIRDVPVAIPSPDA